jgi:hypothetical protein
MKLSIYIVTLFSLTVLSGCDNFEKRFYNSIDTGQVNAIKKGADTFDLSTITDFEWDSVILIRGNESVPVEKDELEEIINNSKEESKLIFKTQDLSTFKDRFYFLTPDKKMIEKEIESGIYKHHPPFDLEYCLIDTINERYWLSKKECKFIVKSNVRTVGQGSVFLYPNCLTKFSPDSITFQDN